MPAPLASRDRSPLRVEGGGADEDPAILPAIDPSACHQRGTVRRADPRAARARPATRHGSVIARDSRWSARQRAPAAADIETHQVLGEQHGLLIGLEERLTASADAIRRLYYPQWRALLEQQD